jgi:hypothetical protein
VRRAEYVALRAEIAQRLSSQQALVALNITAIATIVGFVLAEHTGSKQPSESLLLLVPVVSSVLGLLWLDHDRNIRRIAEYISTELWRYRVHSWEKWSDGKHSPWKEAFYWGAIGIVYGVTSVGPLAIGWPGETGTPGVEVLAGGSVALTALFVGLYVVGFVRAVRNSAN